MLITDAGQTFAHLPQPTHFEASTSALMPLYMEIALRGHMPSQLPQATHSLDIIASFLLAK